MWKVAEERNHLFFHPQKSRSVIRKNIADVNGYVCFIDHGCFCFLAFVSRCKPVRGFSYADIMVGIMGIILIIYLLITVYSAGAI